MPFQIIINIIVFASIYLLIGYSFSLVYNTSKFFNLSHAGFLVLAPYLLYLFYKILLIELTLSIIISVILILIISHIVNNNVFVRLKARSSNTLILLISSLGLYIIIESLISIFFGTEKKLLRSPEIKNIYEISNGFITLINIFSVVSSILLLTISSIIIGFSRFGLKIKSVINNESLAKIYGINIKKISNISFVIGSGLVGLSGILVAFDTGMTPTMGFNLLLYGVVAMIIGGVGSTWGLVGGAILLATAQHLTAYYIDSKWMDAIAYIILILFLIWKPLGFSGKRLKKIEI